MTVSPVILLLGSTGQVGFELARTLAPLGNVVAPGRAELDLGNADAIRSAVREAAPALIVNAAAYTQVDRAEEEVDLAMAINCSALGVLGSEAKRAGAAVVHYSTDYVFPGTSDRPYRESDPVAPVSVYGRSKLAGEGALQATGAAHLIFRTCWVYANRGRNFLLTIQRLARERDQLRVVDDQRGCPTWARLIAEATAQALAQTRSRAGWPSLTERSGVYHLASAGEASWWQFACAIAAATPRSDGSVASVLPIPSREYPTPAQRPAYSVLDCRRLQAAFGLRLPDWRQGLELCLRG
jgi:dTDP-4-dehydrorhamnose reductase